MNKIKKLFIQIALLNKYDFFSVVLFWLFVFVLGEMLFYTVEKLIGIPTVARWYDLVWLLLIYFAITINAVVLIDAMTKKGGGKNV